MDAQYSIIITTCSSPEDAKPIIDALLSEKLAACIQTYPINSFYLWKGTVANDPETILLIKAKAENFSSIKDSILKNHKYELPEIIQVPIVGGYDKYLRWIDNPT